MGILGFLFGFGFLVLIAWAIATLGSLVFGRKRRRSRQRHKQPSLKPSEHRERFGSPQSTIAAPPTRTVPHRQAAVLRQSPVSTKVRLSNGHQQYIQLAALVLEQLRSCEVQLLKALAILRK